MGKGKKLILLLLVTAVLVGGYFAAKYFLKDCKFLGVATAHGLYDFLNVVVKVFIV